MSWKYQNHLYHPDFPSAHRFLQMRFLFAIMLVWLWLKELKKPPDIYCNQIQNSALRKREQWLKVYTIQWLKWGMVTTLFVWIESDSHTNVVSIAFYIINVASFWSDISSHWVILKWTINGCLGLRLMFWKMAKQHFRLVFENWNEPTS